MTNTDYAQAFLIKYRCCVGACWIEITQPLLPKEGLVDNVRSYVEYVLYDMNGSILTNVDQKNTYAFRYGKSFIILLYVECIIKNYSYVYKDSNYATYIYVLYMHKIWWIGR